MYNPERSLAPLCAHLDLISSHRTCCDPAPPSFSVTVRKAGLGQRGKYLHSTFKISSALLCYYSRIFSILRRQESHFLMLWLLRWFLGSRWVGNEREMNDLDPQAPSPALWFGVDLTASVQPQPKPTRSKGCVHFGKIPIAIDSKTQEYHPIAGEWGTDLPCLV